MSEIKRDQQGVDRCQHVVETVMPNDPKNHSLGFRKVKAYCNKPITFSVAENRKICPECDKQPPVGWVNPRVTNAAGTALTPAELKECGLTEDPTLLVQPKKRVRVSRKGSMPVEAKVIKAKKDVISIDVDLSTLETAEDVAATLIRKASAALDQLPVTNFAESKRLIKLQEKLDALLAV